MANNHHVIPVRRDTHDVVPVRRDTHDAHLQAIEAAAEEGVVCSTCGAFYHNRRWTLDTVKTRKNASAHRATCPACRKAQERDPGGIVTLRGGYWTAHREEILNLIRNEEKKAMGTNPVERILTMEEENGHLVIQTTNEKLAQRLGRAVHKACSGEVQYKWSEDTKLARVEWNRDA